jgi:HisJ family histidinol phosphate phosphatase
MNKRKAKKKLTAMQKKFCAEYVKCMGNAAQACRNAGYSDKYADRKAYVLKQDPAVREYLDEMFREKEAADIADADEILKYLIENGKGLEINTKTYRAYGLRTPQLDRDILIRYMELGGEIICLGSDSHKAEQVGAKFDYFAQFVKMFGFRRLGHFEGRKLKMVTI